MKAAKVKLGMRIAYGSTSGVVIAKDGAKLCFREDGTPFEYWTSCAYCEQVPTEEEMLERRKLFTPWMESAETRETTSA